VNHSGYIVKIIRIGTDRGLGFIILNINLLFK
jgi:hypothetical protein